MNRKMIVFCLVAATTVVFSTGCDVPAEPDNTDGDVLAEPADTENTGGDTDAQVSPTRAELCLEESEIDIQPNKSKTLFLYERSVEMLFTSTFKAGPILAAETVRMMHAIEDWVEPALMIYPGYECSVVDFPADVHPGPAIRTSTTESLLVSFGESDPIQEIDYQLGGWFGVGNCGLPVLTSTLSNAADYLEMAPDAESVDVVVFSSAANVSDYEADGATCPCSHQDGQQVCIEYPMLCIDDSGAEVGAQQLHAAGHRVHFAIFSMFQSYGAKGDVWAAAGGTGQAAVALEKSEVEQAVWTVAKRLVSCNLSVDFSNIGSHAATASADKVNLFMNDELIAFDETCQGDGGWYWVDDETVGLCPDSCDDLKDNLAATTFEFSASYGCGSRLEVEP